MNLPEHAFVVKKINSVWMIFFLNFTRKSPRISLMDYGKNVSSSKNPIAKPEKR